MVILVLPLSQIPFISYSGIILSSVQKTLPHIAMLLVLMLPAVVKLPPTISSVLFFVKAKEFTLVLIPTLVFVPSACQP